MPSERAATAPKGLFFLFFRKEDFASGPVCILTLWLCLLATAQAKVFNVRDFGAKPDGLTADGRAVQQAIDAAIGAGHGNEVFFPSGRYLLESPGHTGHFALTIRHASGLTVRGEAGTVLLAPPQDSVFGIFDSQSVGVHQLTLDRNALAYSQMTITSVDPVRRTAVVRVNPGYGDFSSPTIGAATLFVIFDEPGSGTWGDHGSDCAWYGPNDQTVCWPPSIIGFHALTGGTWEVQLNTAARPKDVGKVAVVWAVSCKGHAFIVSGSSDVDVQDVQYYPGGADGGFILSRNTGAITFRRFRVDVRPGSGQLISALGGSMVFNNHIQLMLDQVTIAKVWDDAVNMGANFARVAAHPLPRQIEVDTRQANDWRVGDTVSQWDWGSKTERDEAHVLAVTVVPAHPELTQLSLDRDITVRKMGFAPVVGHVRDPDQIDRVIDLESAGTLHVVDSHFQSYHARGLMVKASNTLIERSEIYDTVMAGIIFGPEFAWDEGPPIRELTVQENVFRNVSGSEIISWQPATDAWRRLADITISDNRFVDSGRYSHGVMGSPGDPILLSDVTGARVHGNIMLSANHVKSAEVAARKNTYAH